MFHVGNVLLSTSDRPTLTDQPPTPCSSPGRYIFSTRLISIYLTNSTFLDCPIVLHASDCALIGLALFLCLSHSMLIPVQLRHLEPRQGPDPQNTGPPNNETNNSNKNSSQDDSGGQSNNVVIIVSLSPRKILQQLTLPRLLPSWYSSSHF